MDTTLQWTTRLLILISIVDTIASSLINISPQDLAPLPAELLESFCLPALPICPSKNVRFYLYTSSSPSEPVELSVANPDSIKNAKFVQGPIKILVHGYTGDKDASPNNEARPAYFANGRIINVISVDYGPLVPIACYIFAMQNTNVAAKCTAQFIEYLLKLRPDIQLSQIHLIGLSLGAQVCGQIADYLTVGKLEEIVSLDAALPLFYRALTLPSREINRGDAKQIIALHTNSGLAGQDLPYGNVDFYANGGSFQPGCAPLDLACDHIRSASIFAETINSPWAFPSYKCSQPPPLVLGQCIGAFGASGPTVYYGENVNLNVTGIYSFNTTASPPYGQPSSQ